MQRNTAGLAGGTFDLLVIGGGIYGSWIACHAARAGLRTALVEQGDWAAGTSSASSKLLHGGLRYLEYFDLGLVRKSLHERKALHERMPHHVRPLQFLLPVYRSARVGRFKLKLGLWLYDRLAGANQPVGGHRSLSADQLLNEMPRLASEQLTGGFEYGDCWTDDARMVLEIVDTAQAAGAVVANYIRAVELTENDGRVVGAEVEDVETGTCWKIRAAATVNAAGAWAEQLMAPGRAGKLARYTKGVHLVMPPLSGNRALLLTAPRDGRVFFLIPWYGRTLLGTTDTDLTADPNAIAVEPADVDYLLEAAAAYVRPAWTREEVLGAFCGVRTLRREEGKRASEVTREWSLEQPRPGLWMPLGGKYTSARVEAREVVYSVLVALGRNSAATGTDCKPMSWFPGVPYHQWREESVQAGLAAGLDEEMAPLAVERHGSRFGDLLARLRAEPGLARRISADAPFCRGEVVIAAENEMARTLLDILRRRIPLLLLCREDRAAFEDAAHLAAPILGWDQERCRREVEAVLSAKRQQFPSDAGASPRGE